MPRVLKKILIAMGLLLCLVVLLWGALAGYVFYNKEKVLTQVSSQINDNIQGKLTIGSMEPALIRGFPGIAVALNDVKLEDSLFPIHRHRLLTAENIYLSVDVWSIIKGSPSIQKLTVTKGTISVFTDSTGYSNTNIFNEQKQENKKTKASIHELSLSEVTVMFRHEMKNKLFRLAIRELDANINHNSNGWDAKLSTSTLIEECNFNLNKGSFLKNRTVSAQLVLQYDANKKQIKIPSQILKLDNQKLTAAALFDISSTPTRFHLSLGTQNVQYKTVVSWLSPSIAAKLNLINIAKPINVQSTVAGRMKYRDTPLVNVRWQVANNTLALPVGDIENCSFTGHFTNEKEKGKGHNDPNSMISVFAFKGSWVEIPFRVDTLHVSNLIHPLLQGRFRSEFPLNKLNAVIGGNSFRFKEGQASLDLLYKGGISKHDTNKAYVFGNIKASGATVAYLPRSLEFRNSSATVLFRGRDLFINNVRIAQGNSVLKMNGSILNFLSLYYTDPGKMTLNWEVNSDAIDLDDFTSFLGRRKNTMTPEKSPAKKNNTVAVKKISSQMDRVLAEGKVALKVQLKKLSFRSFSATNVNADLMLNSSDITLRNFDVHHAGGRLKLNGIIHQHGSINDFAVKADVNNVNVQQFFTAFNNFSQDAITAENIRGNLFANADVKGSIRDNGKMVPYSLTGTAGFNLTNGALVNFSPLEKIGKLVFRNRDVSNIEIRSLKNVLTINGDKVTIPPMYIESSALNVQVDGVYAFRKGTHINIDVPLKNPKRSELIVNDSLRQEKGMKGLVIHFKAVDGDDGNVKIKWTRKRSSTEEK
ncbi:MAG TPA: AsmA-like C-terminal region-containing protein [Flavipsychrobacter sp.]|nr:AsmA-like C-terminal region-containing protein [Flavipsychrobacter sp.]